jgi:hypothetical protein
VCVKWWWWWWWEAGICTLYIVQEILPLHEENAVDLHSMGSPLTLATMVGENVLVDTVRNKSLYHGVTFVPPVAICQVFRL